MELAVAKPALMAAHEAVNCLDKASLTELKSFSKVRYGSYKQDRIQFSLGFWSTERVGSYLTVISLKGYRRMVFRVASSMTVTRQTLTFRFFGATAFYYFIFFMDYHPQDASHLVSDNFHPVRTHRFGGASKFSRDLHSKPRHLFA